MVLAIAYVYGWDIHAPDMITDILLVFGGSASINALKKLDKYSSRVCSNILGDEWTKKL